jgi:hypothetical protein
MYKEWKNFHDPMQTPEIGSASAPAGEVALHPLPPGH